MQRQCQSGVDSIAGSLVGLNLNLFAHVFNVFAGSVGSILTPRRHQYGNSEEEDRDEDGGFVFHIIRGDGCGVTFI